MTPEETARLVLELDAKATPGEWQWYGCTRHHDVYLSTIHGGRIFVMQFDRWGMQSGQPVFQWPLNCDSGIMYPLAKLPPEAGPDYVHEWDGRFVGIKHPDAALIAQYRTAAPAIARAYQDQSLRLDTLTLAAAAVVRAYESGAPDAALVGAIREMARLFDGKGGEG